MIRGREGIKTQQTDDLLLMYTYRLDVLHQREPFTFSDVKLKFVELIGHSLY